MSVSNYRVRGALTLGALFLVAGLAQAATSWSSFRPREDNGSQCLRIGAQELDYYVLDEEDIVTLRVRGPRRLKIITRYLFGESDPAGASYRVWLRVDGREELRRTFRATALPSVTRCGRGGDVGALRKFYLSVPTGLHDIQVMADSPGDGRVSARFFRESRGRQTKMVNFSPEQYDGVHELQFESGSLSTYYHFSEDQPLGFTVIGPTTLEIDTRLDFDHTMNGSTAYQLEVVQDGEPLPRFFYHTTKLSTASYVERRDILPGERKRMKLTVPRGRHEYEIHCVGPQTCGVAVKIRIPEADLQGK
ncbi:hypothetical protein H8E52_12545 [bacterium]|nr:hypothetical protein [bacterium]